MVGTVGESVSLLTPPQLYSLGNLVTAKVVLFFMVFENLHLHFSHISYNKIYMREVEVSVEPWEISDQHMMVVLKQGPIPDRGRDLLHV